MERKVKLSKINLSKIKLNEVNGRLGGDASLV